MLGDLLVDPVAAEVPLLLLDLRLLDAVPGGVDLGAGGEHLGAEAVDAGGDLLQVALGGGDLPLVLVDGGGGLVALAGELAALLLEVVEDLAVGGDLGLAPLGEGPPLGRPLAELLHGQPVGLQELLPPLDQGAELGHLLVALGHAPRQLVQPLAPGGEGGLVAVEVGGEPGLPRGGLLEAGLQLGQPRRQRRPAAEEHGLQQLAILLLLLLVAPRRAGLALERAQGPLDLGDHVVEPQQVRHRLLELDLGDALARLVARDAGRLLDQLAPFLGLAGEDHADLPLLDDGVGPDAEAGVHQQVLDLLQARHLAVEPVLPLAAAEDPPTDGDPAVLGAGEGEVGAQGEHALGHPQRLAAVGAVEDDVLHGAAAQGLGALLAEHPGDRFREVALAAAVGADDGGDAAGEADFHRIDKGLEAGDLEALDS